MKVIFENHYGAVLLTDSSDRTMLMQGRDAEDFFMDYPEIVDYDEIEISDEYAEYFEEDESPLEAIVITPGMADNEWAYVPCIDSGDGHINTAVSEIITTRYNAERFLEEHYENYWWRHDAIPKRYNDPTIKWLATSEGVKPYDL